MAAHLNINHGVLSRLKYKHGAGLSDDTLVNIMEHIGENTDEKARFLASYLRDRMVGPDEVRARIRILVDDPVRMQEPSRNEIADAACQLERVANKNPRVRSALISLSELASSC